MDKTPFHAEKEERLLNSIEPWIVASASKRGTGTYCPREIARETLRDYKVLHTAEILRQRKCERIALQYPDSLLIDSFIVCAALEAALATDDPERVPLIFILGDTSYGECCVDEIAARHLNADMVVHYGNACLSPTRTLPVLYVFPRRERSIAVMQPQTLLSVVNHVFKSSRNAERIVVLYDIEDFEVLLGVNGALSRAIRSLPNLGSCVPTVIAEPRVDISGVVMPRGDATLNRKANCCDKNANLTGAETCKGSSCFRAVGFSHCCSNGEDALQFNCQGWREVGPLKFGMDAGIENDNECSAAQAMIDSALESRTSILWVSLNDRMDESVQLRNAALLHGGVNFAGFFVWQRSSEKDYLSDDLSSIEQVNSSKLLMKRYHLLESARDAERIGIVAGTLGISGNLAIIEYCKRTIERSGKRWYVLLVGKPTPTKLGNFQEIDVFVLIACPQTALLDSKEYFRPVITPLELDVALRGRDFFSEGYSVDFNYLLAELQKTPDSTEKANPSDDEDIVDSLDPNLLQAGEQSVATRGGWDVSVGTSGSAAHSLHRRSWQGLDPSRNAEGVAIEDLPTAATTGRKGTAAKYLDEG